MIYECLCRKRFSGCRCVILMIMHFGDVLSCVTNDVDTLSNALQETLQRVLAAILTFIFVIGMMFYIHIILACIAILIIPLSLIVTGFL